MAIDITGGNVANVNTPGYTRQCLELRSVGSTNTRDGNTQIGVVISRVEQIYNNHQLVGQTSLSDFFSH